jgi:hypothetical protein
MSKQRKGNESRDQPPLGKTKTSRVENTISAPSLLKITGNANPVLVIALDEGTFKVPPSRHTSVNRIHARELAGLYDLEGLRFEDNSTPSTPNAPHQCHSKDVPRSNRRSQVRVITLLAVDARFDSKSNFFPRSVREKTKSSSNAPGPVSCPP